VEEVNTNMDLHTFLEELKKDRPYDILEVNKRVDPFLEVSTVLWHLEMANKNLVTVFNSVNNLKGAKSTFKVVTNIFASRDRCAYILNTNPESISQKYGELERKTIEPVIVKPEDAPVKDVVKKDDEVNLSELPIIQHHERDAGPYITAGVCVAKHSTYGYNAAILRLQYKNLRKLGVFMIPGKHTDLYFKCYKESGKDMPIAIVIGHHPRFYLGSQTTQPIEVDEYKVIGGVMGKPLRLTHSESLGKDFLIPADAEIVIEGKVLVDVEEPEGPFGEFSRYYGYQVERGRVIEVTAINMKKDAIYQDIFAGHADHIILGAIPIEAKLLYELRRAYSSIKNVHLPLSGGGRFTCYIQIKKNFEGETKNILLAVLGIHNSIKLAVTVDEDINIFDESQIMWALATRAKFSENIFVIPKCQRISLDPVPSNFSDKLGIDATFPLDKRMETLKPPEKYKQISFEDYLK